MLYFQGDVGIKKIEKLPEGVIPSPPDNERNILAYGEVTGHAHALPAATTELYATNDNSRLYLVVKTKEFVTHEEHDPIQLDQGIYEIIRQREYDDEKEWRQVAD